MKFVKATLILIFITGQFAAFEAFERFYYKFEDRYTKYTNRLKFMPITKIFDEKLYDAMSEGEFGEISYDTDEYGFRTVDVDYNHKRGTRFMFVGSFSMGWGTGVPADHTFAAFFGRKLAELRPDAEFEVINANKGAFPISNTLAELKDVFHTRIRPDVIILGSYTSDNAYPRHPGETLEERVFSGDVAAFTGGNTIVKKNGMIIVSKVPHSNAWNEVYSRSYVMGRFLAYADIKIAVVLDVFGRRVQASTDNSGYLEDLNTYLDRHGIPFLVVLLPKLGGEQDAYRKVVNDDLKVFCARDAVPLLDIDQLRPVYEYTFVSDGHYSAKSNEYVGGDIARWVDKIFDDHFRLK